MVEARPSEPASSLPTGLDRLLLRSGRVGSRSARPLLTQSGREASKFKTRHPGISINSLDGSQPRLATHRALDIEPDPTPSDRIRFSAALPDKRFGVFPLRLLRRQVAEPVQREQRLAAERMRDPGGAVLVDHRQPTRRRHVVCAALRGRLGHKFEDGGLGRAVVP